MSEKIGKIVTCDRCGREIFLNYTGTSHLDGGFTKIEHFEKMPDGWRVRESYGKDYIMLCPDCNNEIELLHKKFMGVDNE